MDTAKNKADGSVTFKSQSFTSPGKYEYTITEKAGNEAGVTYDKTVHKVTVEVAYDTNGKLVATVTGNGPTFTNTYAAKTPQHHLKKNQTHQAISTKILRRKNLKKK